MKKTDLKSMNEQEICDIAVSMGEKAFRGKQVYQWILKGVIGFGEMKNLPKAFLSSLEEGNYYIESLDIVKKERSAIDETAKYAFALSDGLIIESVFMKYKYGNSICISSQAGCGMGCTFCASGENGLERNLTSGEMLAQIDAVERDTGEKINHIVVMGTGEPMYNLDNLCRMIDVVHDKNGRNLSMRNITVSSCGILPKMREFYRRYPTVNIAISLHDHDPVRRARIMPVENRYGIDEIMKFSDEYTKETGRRITYEYTLIRGVNDSKDDAAALGKLLKKRLCHVNLIPLNETCGNDMKGTSVRQAAEFKNTLESLGVTATIRRTLGSDISGACGQLRLGVVDDTLK